MRADFESTDQDREDKSACVRVARRVGRDYGDIQRKRSGFFAQVSCLAGVVEAEMRKMNVVDWRIGQANNSLAPKY
jgi:hypothetical protein